MNILEKIRKSARSAVTTAEVFLSRYMAELIGSKLGLIAREYRVSEPRLHMMFDPSSNITAMTSLSDMTINAGHPMYEGDDEARFLKVCGVLLHEMGHILFTNYTAHVKWMKDMRSGIFWPAEPSADETALAKIRSFATGPLSDAFCAVAHDVSNVLEDGRIENFIMKLLSNVRFMTKGLIKMRQETYAEMEPFEDIAGKVSSGELPKVYAVIDLILHYARFGEVKGNFDPSSEVGEIFTEIMPEIDVYLKATEAVVYYGAFNNIICLMADVIEEYFDKAISEQSMPQSLQDLMKDLSGCTQPQNNPQDQQSDSGDGASKPAGGQPAGDESSDGSADSADGQSSDPASDSPSESDSGRDGSGQSAQPSPTAEQQAKMQEAASEIAQALQEMLDEMAGKTVDQSSNMGEQAKGSDRGAVKRRIEKMGLGNEVGTVTTPEAAQAANGSGCVTHKKAEDLNLGLVLQDIARKISDEETEKLISSEVKAEYGSVSKAVKDYSEIHRHCDITMYHYDGVTDTDKELYGQIANAVSPMVRRAVKSSNFYEKDRMPYVEDGLFSGKSLNVDRAYRGDGRIFSKRHERDEPPNLAVAVRIDCSGSMGGSRLEAARRCCVFLYEYVLGMEKRYGVKIPLYIYGDNVRGSGVSMYVFADDKFRTPTEKYRLMNLAAGGCNRDGLPIRMAVKRLEQEQPYAQKVLFNITDGQPNDSGYGGQPAFDDLRDITHYCEKHRIALAACAIGSDRDKIEEIYGTSHFMNISDLDELPVRLVKILKKLLK